MNLTNRKVTLVSCDDRPGTLKEVYKEGDRGSFTEEDTDLEAWANRLIERFNATLRPGELPRRVVSITVDSEEFPSETLAHTWEKTNLITREFRGQYFDTLRCKRCRITAKRYGLDNIVHDQPFRAKKHTYCRPPQFASGRGSRRVKKGKITDL